MDKNLYFHIWAIFNFYMPIRNIKFALRHFSSCCKCGETQEADKAISIGFGPGHKKGMLP